MNYQHGSEDDTNDFHVWKEYVRVETLPLIHSTIKRAQDAGIGESLLKLVADVQAAVEQLGIRENNYEDRPKSLEQFKKQSQVFKNVFMALILR